MDLEKSNSASTFLGGMAERLGAAARTTTIFGDPVERDGLTVIPVASALWGFGGGVGQRKHAEGGGGGGGMQITPVGFIELKNGAAEFRPIRRVSFNWIIAGGLAALFLLRKARRQNRQ